MKMIGCLNSLLNYLYNGSCVHLCNCWMDCYSYWFHCCRQKLSVLYQWMEYDNKMTVTMSSLYPLSYTYSYSSYSIALPSTHLPLALTEHFFVISTYFSVKLIYFCVKLIYILDPHPYSSVIALDQHPPINAAYPPTKDSTG